MSYASGVAARAGTSDKYYGCMTKARPFPGEGVHPWKAGPLATGRDGSGKMCNPWSLAFLLEPRSTGSHKNSGICEPMTSTGKRHPQIPSEPSLGLSTSREEVCSHLAPNISALGPQFVDLGLSDVCPLLSLLQLVLGPPAPGQLRVGLLLLSGRRMDRRPRQLLTLALRLPVPAGLWRTGEPGQLGSRLH